MPTLAMKELLEALLANWDEDLPSTGVEDGTVVAWRDVQAFLKMAETAMMAKAAAAQNARQAETIATHAAASSRDQTEFLESELATLCAEKEALQKRLEDVQRECACLRSETMLLRQQVAGAVEHLCTLNSTNCMRLSSIPTCWYPPCSGGRPGAWRQPCSPRDCAQLVSRA